MPRARQPASPPPDEARDPSELLDELGELFQSAGPGAQLYLFRTWPRPPGARQEAFLEKYDGEAPTYEDVRTTFGGGGYRLRMLEGGKRTKHSVAFHIEGPPKYQDGAGAAGGEEPSRLDRLEQMIAELAARGTDEDDERDFKRMMNRAIVARSIGEALRQSPLGDLRELLGFVRELKEEREPDATTVEGGPWWAPLAARALDAMERKPQAPAPAPPAVAARRPDELPPAGQSAELDAFLAMLAGELDNNASVERLFDVVRELGPEAVAGFLQVTPEVWSGFLRAAAARHPVLGTMVARAKLGELLRRLHAAAAKERADEQGQE